MSSLPSAWWSWSARSSVLLMRLTTCGTELAGYSDWSGYISPARLASAATCQPLTGRSPCSPALTCCIAWLPVSAPSALTNGSLVQVAPQLLGAEPRERMLDRRRCRAGAPRPRRSSRGVMPAQRGLVAQSWRSCSAVGSGVHGGIPWSVGAALAAITGIAEAAVAAKAARTYQIQTFVGGQGQELGELVGVGQALEQRDRLVDARCRRAGAGGRRAAPAGRAARGRTGRSRPACRRRGAGRRACSHCHSCARAISAVAASSISQWIGTQPWPSSQAAR